MQRVVTGTVVISVMVFLYFTVSLLISVSQGSDAPAAAARVSKGAMALPVSADARVGMFFPLPRTGQCRVHMQPQHAASWTQGACC